VRSVERIQSLDAEKYLREEATAFRNGKLSLYLSLAPKQTEAVTNVPRFTGEDEH
jgi:hypothetical protein